MCIESLREVRIPRRLSSVLELTTMGISTASRGRSLSCLRSLTPQLTGQSDHSRVHSKLNTDGLLVLGADRTKLSKALITDASKLEYRSATELRAKYGVDFRAGTEVTGVELATKEVVVGPNQEKVPYDTLVLATGGTPRRLPIPGKDLSNVYTLRSVEDTKKIDAGMSALWGCLPGTDTHRV